MTPIWRDAFCAKRFDERLRLIAPAETQPGNRPTHEADFRLVREVEEGVPEARRRFADRMRCVHRILAARNVRLGRPFADDELSDLAQETLLRIWQKVGQYAGLASLETWAYKFCYLELMNALRKKARAPKSLSVLATGDGDFDVAAPPRREGSEPALDKLLRHLAPREAEVLRLRHVEQLDNGEVAQFLGISVSSVKTHYYRGLDKLRGVLRAAGEESAL